MSGRERNCVQKFIILRKGNLIVLTFNKFVVGYYKGVMFVKLREVGHVKFRMLNKIFLFDTVANIG